MRQLLETYSALGVRFFAPDVVFDDAAKYLPALLKKREKSVETLTASIEYLQAIIEPVAADLYLIYEKDARHRLSGRDELDWPVLGAALALACPIWTEDTYFSESASRFGRRITSRYFFGHRPLQNKKNSGQPRAAVATS